MFSAIFSRKLIWLRDTLEAEVNVKILKELSGIIDSKISTLGTTFAAELIQLFQQLLDTYSDGSARAPMILGHLITTIERQYPGAKARAAHLPAPAPSRVRRYIDALEQHNFGEFSRMMGVDKSYGLWRNAVRGVSRQTLTPQFIAELTAALKNSDPEDDDTIEQLIEIIQHRIDVVEPPAGFSLKLNRLSLSRLKWPKVPQDAMQL